jgi:DNA-binding MarR family transcriptional regulator
MVRKPTVSPLDAHLGYWLRLVSNQVSHAFALKVNAHGVTVAEWVVLRELFDGPGIMQIALAERMGMTRGAISKLADRLVGKGLVERLDDKKDRRTQHLRLTKNGRELVPLLSALADRNDAEFFGHLSKSVGGSVETTM